MTGKSGKRPMRPLSPRQKLSAIQRVHDGESKAAVARDLGVPESTLRGWCKNELKILESIRTANASNRSSPETDGSTNNAEYYEAKKKRRRTEENGQTNNQPFNLTIRPNTSCTSLPSTSGTSSYSPDSENRYSLDLTTKNEDKSPAPLDLKTKPNKVTVPKTSPRASTSTTSTITPERERTRVELARMSVELGLNAPERYASSSVNSSELTNMLSAHWNQLLLQQAKNLGTRDHGSLLTTVSQQREKQPAVKLPNDKLSVDESVRFWLNSSSPNLSPNSVQTNAYPTSLSTPMTGTGNTTSPMTGITPEQNAWINMWYRTVMTNQIAQYSNQTQQPPEKILYHQLTKAKQEKNNVENLATASLPEDRPGAKNITNTKARAVLDTLLLNNNNITANVQKDGESVTQNEAVTHGEKFLRWLESCSEPSVTAMQIMQFRSLLTNVKASADRKNGGVQIKAKMRRK